MSLEEFKEMYPNPSQEPYSYPEDFDKPIQYFDPLDLLLKKR